MTPRWPLRHLKRAPQRRRVETRWPHVGGVCVGDACMRKQRSVAPSSPVTRAFRPLEGLILLPKRAGFRCLNRTVINRQRGVKSPPNMYAHLPTRAQVQQNSPTPTRSVQSHGTHQQLRGLDPHHKADPMAIAQRRADGARLWQGGDGHGWAVASRRAYHQVSARAARARHILDLGGQCHTPTRWPKRSSAGVLVGESLRFS